VADTTELPGLDGTLGEELRAALAIVRRAGAEVHALQTGELKVEMKPGDEPVTVADKRGSEIICDGLAQAFPNDPVISEELPPPPGAQRSQRLWFVDPIDGTKDFIRGEDGYSVMVGLLVGDRPALGLVYQPVQDRMFYATPDGAWVASRGTVHPIHVSACNEPGAVRLVASKSHRSPDIDRVKAQLGIRDEENIGSVGVKLCLIAAGAYDLYVNPQAKTKAWDTCAPEAILARAAGRISDLDGAPVDYRGDLAHRRGLVASNGLVHDAVLARLQPLFPRR
jgi:3'(2'), 5'-bisphosphate nucleotidase